MMSGNHLAQLNTQCDHEHEQCQSWVGHKGSTPGIWVQSQGMSTTAAAAQELLCNEEFAQRNGERCFSMAQLFVDVPANLFLSYSRAEPMVSRQENPSKQQFARPGDRFFHTEFCY